MKVLVGIGLSLTSIILVLAAVEIGWRAYEFFTHPSQTACYEPTKIPGLPYIAKANFHRKGFQTNSHHLRNAELPLAKPEGTYRVAVVGNSMTIGHNVAQKHLFTDVLGRDLQQRFGNQPRVEVINAGQMGYSIGNFQSFSQHIVYPYEPDLILYQFCWNDNIMTTSGNAPRMPDRPVNNWVMRWLYKSRIMANAAKMRNIEEFVANTLDNWDDPKIRDWFYKDLAAWAEEVNSHNIKFVTVLFPLGLEVQAIDKYPEQVATIRRIKSEIIEWCRQNNIEAYDLSIPLQEEYQMHHKNLFMDQGHFNRAGHLCVAKYLEQLPIYNFEAKSKE